MNYIKLILKNYKKYRKSLSFRARFIYTKYYEKLDIDNNSVLIQSYAGSSISGSPYYILEELYNNEAYKHLNISVVADKTNYLNIKKLLLRKGFNKVNVVKIHTRKYTKLLARSKYLINNTTFPAYFIKREGQVYLNTWHGTPLKNLGRKINNAPNEIGNAQKNFLMSDYLLYPNYFTFDHMREDYMLSKFYIGKYIIGGYPRNTIFFDENKSKELKIKLGLNDKKIVVYMPTWRGNLLNNESESQNEFIIDMLNQLEDKLSDDTLLYVKLHSLTSSKIDYSKFKKIKPFPNEYETYEFLSIADCLITDYSSVFFDYAITGRKIILYGYDKEKYLNDKGMYLNYENLPFTFVYDLDNLLDEINSVTRFSKYKKFNNEYNLYDNKDATKKLCNYIFNKEKSDLIIIDGKKYHNNKKNILIFTGSLAKNGITTALKSLMKSIDTSKYNYVLTFYKNSVEKNKQTINEFDFVDYIPIQGQRDLTIKEAIYQFLYYRLNIHFKFITKGFDKVYSRECKRVFSNINFKYAIHYTGYEKYIIRIIGNLNSKKFIYIHSDVNKEIQVRKNINADNLKYAFDKFDKVVCIRESSKDEIIKFYPKIDSNKIVVAHNFNDIKGIKDKAQQKLKFDDNTCCNIEFEELKKILKSNNEIILNVSRFSPEKGLERLINAFVEYNKENPESYLIIVGGHGILYDKINDLANEVGNKHIIIIKSLSNPYPIFKRADLFVLSSFYEGLPMVIMEALILNIPVMSTMITGPYEFLNQGYGYLVPNDEKGILNGLFNYKKETFKKFDAEKFNNNALKEFNNLLK